MMESQESRDVRKSEGAWQDRQRYWRRKLGRLRLGVEPLDEQLARYRRVTWMLTAVPFAIGLMFLGLFAAFGRPGIGLIVAAVLFAPLVVIAWVDYAILRWRVGRYLDEQSRHAGEPTSTGRG